MSHHAYLMMTMIKIVTSQSFYKAFFFQQEAVLHSQFLGHFNVFMRNMKKQFKIWVPIKILRIQ